jgi:uncharacterized protein YihD (DUF1040 family)
MRNPARIDEILALLERAWREHPDMRFTQMLCNLLDPTPNRLFYIEDDVLLDGLHDLLATGVWPTQRTSG